MNLTDTLILCSNAPPTFCDTVVATEAMLLGGQTVDASIVVGVVNDEGLPIVNFAWQDIWLNPETDTVFICNIPYPWGFVSDSSTDDDGETTFATSLAGGGWTEDPIYVYLNYSRAMSPDFVYFPPVPLRINSPDINADGVVNLIDVSDFADDYFGAYHYRSDFWWDGVLNLSDVAKMTAGYGASCE